MSIILPYIDLGLQCTYTLFIPDLVGYSLVQHGNSGASNPESYYVHYIVMDYLMDTLSKEKQVIVA